MRLVRHNLIPGQCRKSHPRSLGCFYLKKLRREKIQNNSHLTSLCLVSALGTNQFKYYQSMTFVKEGGIQQEFSSSHFFPLSGSWLFVGSYLRGLYLSVFGDLCDLAAVILQLYKLLYLAMHLHQQENKNTQHTGALISQTSNPIWFLMEKWIDFFFYFLLPVISHVVFLFFVSWQIHRRDRNPTHCSSLW